MLGIIIILCLEKYCTFIITYLNFQFSGTGFWYSLGEFSASFLLPPYPINLTSIVITLQLMCTRACSAGWALGGELCLLDYIYGAGWGVHSGEWLPSEHILNEGMRVHEGLAYWHRDCRLDFTYFLAWDVPFETMPIHWPVLRSINTESSSPGPEGHWKDQSSLGDFKMYVCWNTALGKC